jgi:hypothetical protein
MRRTLALLLLVVPVCAQDLSVIGRIKGEAFDRSKVMDTLYQITDVRGPRLTGSPGFDDAAQWTVARLKQYGLQNVHLEHWGPFGRAWSLEESSVELLEPRYQRLEAAPLAWSASSSGAVNGDLVLAPLRASFRDGPKKVRAALDAYKAEWSGKLRGKIVLLNEPHVPKPQSSPQFRRYTDSDLHDIATAPAPAPATAAKSLSDLEWPEDPDELGKLFAGMPNALMEQIYDLYDAVAAEKGAFFAKEGALGVLMEDDRAHEGMLFAEAAGGFKATDTAAPPTFVITAEQYDRIARGVQNKASIKVRLSLKAKISDRDVDGSNIVGEIPGGSRKEEVVMVGAHFDSWHTGTGATDNGAGSAVMIEVMRILKELNLKLDRTVRIGLWSGEEQGLFGSRAYVKEHAGKAAKISGYFNLDNGSGKIRGVYLQGNDAMRPVFEGWLAPFRDLGVSTVSIRNTGGTDHLSFDAAGIPGFQFIQDPLDYSTITHHSNMDTYDHAVPEDLMQAAAVIASVVYETANRREMLPRR